MAAPTADHNRDIDIVERALAILDEESRSWVILQQGLASQAEGPSGPDGHSGDAA